MPVTFSNSQNLVEPQAAPSKNPTRDSTARNLIILVSRYISLTIFSTDLRNAIVYGSRAR